MNSQNMPRPKPGVMDIAAYVPGRETVEGVAKIYKLSSNESPLGPSPRVAEVLAAQSANFALYPDGGSHALRDAISKTYGLNSANIICGNGSDELLGLLCQTYLAPGDEGIITEHGFLVYKIQITAAGAKPVVVPEKDLTVDIDQILGAVTDKTKLVFIANPGNPTGTYIPVSEVRRLHAGLPPHVVLVLDAAYAEYVRRNDYEAGVELVSANANVVMTRTFSKIHGLAALRIGWMYGPEAIIDACNRVRGPFNVNALAIAAGAVAIADRTHVERSIDHNDNWMARVCEAVEGLGLSVTPSVCNFVLIHFPKIGKTAAEADEYLGSRGYVLRRVAGYGLPDSLRLTLGTEEANLGFIDVLKDFMAK